MSTPRVQEDSYGLLVTVTMTDPNDGDAPVDLTGAVVTFRFKDPDGERLEVTATVAADPTTGVATYRVTSSDGVLDSPGAWRVQAIATFAVDSIVRSEVGSINVRQNIEAP